MNKEFLQKSVSLVPGVIRRDFLRKVISLFFALLVWLSVSNRLGKVSSISKVNVNVILPHKLVRLDERKLQVTLRVSASENRLERLYPNAFKINIRVEEEKYIPGDPYQIEVKPDDVNAPFGVNVISVEPKSFFIDLDRAASRLANVKAKFSGFPPPGYTTGKITLSPTEVTITGPSRLISKIEEMQTLPIPLTDAIESFDIKDLAIQNNYKNMISIAPSKVLVQVEIKKEFMYRTFKNIPINVIEAAGNEFVVNLLNVPNTDVELAAPQNVIETVKPEDISAFIDLSHIDKAGTVDANISCWVNKENVIVKKIIPSQVKVKITDIKKQKKK